MEWPWHSKCPDVADQGCWGWVGLHGLRALFQPKSLEDLWSLPGQEAQ